MAIETNSLLLVCIVGISVGVGVSLLGTFIILRRMALVGDALSHVALPGIALAVVLDVNPFIGASLFLLLAVIAITLLERNSVLPIDALVGVFFTAALGIGALISPTSESLLEALFGDISNLRMIDAQIAIVVAVFVVITTVVLFRDFAMLTLSRELAHSEGVAVERTEFIFLLLLAIIIAVGIRIIGTLLIGALVIIPASVAKNISNSLRGMAIVSVVVGIATVVLGSVIAVSFNMVPGPVITVIAATFFVLSLILRKFQRDG